MRTKQQSRRPNTALTKLCMSWLMLGVVFAGSLFLTANVAEACPNCKDALAESDPAALGIVQGFFWSIMLMLSMPALILVGLSTYFYLLVRQARRAAATGAANPDLAVAIATMSPMATDEDFPCQTSDLSGGRSALPTWEEVMARERAQERAGV